jgi:hypothetical protein
VVVVVPPSTSLPVRSAVATPPPTETGSSTSVSTYELAGCQTRTSSTTAPADSSEAKMSASGTEM